MGKAQILAQYLAQIGHESGRFIYDRELWGPTPAQARYDSRTDLGNTAAADGDGKKYMGRTGIQITGRANTEAFRDWCRAQGLPAPDFVDTPDLMNTDPYEGLGPVWYWSTRNFNRLALEGATETITVKINGGRNGLDDRLALLVRASLVLLGRPLVAGALKSFQAEMGLIPDDDPGPKTRTALHAALGKLDAAGEVAPVPAPVISVPATPSLPVAVAPPLVAAPIGTIDQYLTIIEASAAAIRQIRTGQE
jgi:putative chitinase